MVFVSNVCRNHLVYGVMYQDCFAFISCTSYLIGIVGSDIGQVNIPVIRKVRHCSIILYIVILCNQQQEILGQWIGSCRCCQRLERLLL